MQSTLLMLQTCSSLPIISQKLCTWWDANHFWNNFLTVGASIIVLFQSLLQQKVYVIMTFVYINLADIYWEGSLFPEIIYDPAYPVNSYFISVPAHFLFRKNFQDFSRIFQYPKNIFPGLCHTPATCRYRDKQKLATEY